MEPNSVIPDNISVGLVSEPSTLSPAEQGSIIMPNSVNVGEFSDLKPEGADFGLLSGMNQDVNRASNQSGLDQLGNFLVNAGAEILGGTIEGAGYLADFQQHANLIRGTEEEFSNWFSDMGKSLKEGAEESFPIYEAKPGEFNPWDSGFWAKNGVSIASSLSLLIPARGATGILSKLGKGLGAERMLAKGASLLGKEGEAMQVAIRAAKQNTKGITAAILSRTMENTMESSGTFEEIYNTKLAEGYSEEDARNSAGEGARDVWYKNSVMLLQDIPQYMFLFKAPGLLKSEGKQLQKLMSGTTLKDVGTQFVSEAGEEVYQSVVGQEAKAKQLDKEYKNLSFEERLVRYLKEDEVLTSALFGGLGGAVVTVGGRAWENQVAKRYQNYEDMKLASSVGKDNLVQQVKDKQSIEVLSNHLDDLDKVKSEVEEIAKEEGADKTQIQNVLSDIDVAEQTKNSLVGTIEDKYIPAATQLNVEANQAARRLNKTTEQLNGLKELDSVKAQLNKVGTQAFDYNVSVNALKQIDKLRKQYSKNPIAQEALDELEKEHNQVVNDLAEYNKPISGITNQLNQHVNDLLVNEIEHRTKSKEFEEVSIGNTAVLDERVKKAEIEQLKVEKDIDKLLTIRDNEDVELSKVAKSRLSELYKGEDKVIPENIEELVSFYEKNPLTFKTNLKEYGLPKETTLEEFNTIVQTPEFINQFEAKKQSQIQDNKVAIEEAKVVEEVVEPVVVEETPIASIDESNLINTLTTNSDMSLSELANLNLISDSLFNNSISKIILDIAKQFDIVVRFTNNKQDLPEGAAANFDSNSGRVLINLTNLYQSYLNTKNNKGRAGGTMLGVKGINTFNEFINYTITHELIHGVTQSAYNDVFTNSRKGKYSGKLNEVQVNAIKTIGGIFNYLKTLDSTTYFGGIEYGLHNMSELMAEMSNEGFVSALQRIELPENLRYNSKNTNIFSSLISLIRDFFSGKVVENNAADSLFAAISDIVTSPQIQNFTRPTITNESNQPSQVEADINATKSTKQQFDITNQEEQDDLVDLKEGEWTDTAPNRIKTTDAYMYYYDDGVFYVPSMKDGKFTEEDFNSKYQKGNTSKGYHVLYDQKGQVVFMKNEPTLDVTFLRNLSQVGDVYNEPVTLEVDRNYTSGDKSWSNSKPLGDDKNGWKSLKVAVKIQGRTIGFLPDYDGVRIDPNNLQDLSKFEQLRKTIFNNVKSSQGIFTYPFKTTLKSINPPRFWQGPRTTDLLPLQQLNSDGTKKPIILGLVKNGKLFLNNAPIEDKQKEELEGKFNLSDGAVYWLLTNPVTGDYVPYRLFTSKVKDNPKVQESIKKLLSEVTEQDWKDKRNELQELVRWKNDVGKYEPDFGYTKAGKFFVVKDGEKVYDITPSGVYDFYVNERGFNIIEDSPLQVEAEQLNQTGYNEALIKQGYFSATLNAGLFHSPNFRINIEPLVENKTQVVKETVPEAPDFSIKDNRPIVKWNEQKETQWFKDKIGNLIDLNIVDDSEMNSVVESLKYIHGKDNVEAWGFFHNAAVWISKNAKVGTTQHEAFHVIFNLVLTKTQQESLLDWGAKEYGIDRNKKADNELMFSIAQNVGEAQIEYTLKIVNALNKIQRNKFDNTKLQGWLNDLSKYGVTKQQLEIFQEYAKDGMTKEEIIASISADLSFVVESNVTTKKSFKELGSDPYIEFQKADNIITEEDLYYVNYSSKEGWQSKSFNAKKEAELFLESLSDSEIPTSFYSNITVAGGTNYTENEIKTPQIIPSIKGHAQFSTNEGIGWFRSDEQVTNGAVLEPDDFFQSDAFTEAGATSRSPIATVGGTNTKTRRILELQSDLFQKGRDTENLLKEFESQQLLGYDEDGDPITTIPNDIPFNKSKNKFLQLLNKDNAWVTFFIKSIIQDSQKKGYEKVLFPKGETAAKIEGHDTLANEIKQLQDVIDNPDNYLVDDKLKDYLNDTSAVYAVEQRNGGFLKYTSKEDMIKETKNTISNLKSQGIEKLKPIEGFYEVKVGNVLKKNYKIKEVVDEYGNGWWEIDMTSMPKETILLSTSREEYYKQLSGDVQIEEKLADAFAEYVQMAQVDEAKLKQTPWYKQLGASIKRLFRKMYLAIKASVGLNLSQDEVFFRINSGAYKNNKNFKRNVDVFKPSIKAYADNLKQQDRLTLVQTYFNQKFVEFRDKKQKEGWKEQQILDAAIKPTLNGRLNEDNIYYQLSIMFNDTAQDRLSKGNQYQYEQYKETALKLYDGDVVSDRIADKFGPLYNNAIDNLKNYGIRVNRLQGDLDINDETQDTLENWMEVHPPSAYESMSKQIKVGLSSLMRGEYEGDKYVAERDDLGFPRFVDAFEVYSYLKDELSDSLSVEDFMKQLSKLGEDISWAKVLHQILSGSRQSTIIVDTELFKSQLYQFFQEPAPTFKYLLQTIKNKKEGQYEWRFNNSASKSIATRLSTEWLSNINSPLYNKTLEGGKVEELKTQLSEYKDDNNWLYKALNDLGITLSKEAIESVTATKKGNKRDFLKHFENVVDNVGKENFDELLSVKNSLIEMAKLVKKYYPEFHLPAFTNVEGETVQNYIRNSFMARQLNKFKSSKYRKELIDFYRTDKFYAENDRKKKDTKTNTEVRDDSYSLWLDRIQNDAAYNKMDFAVLDGQKLAGESTGTPYADLSPLEFNRMTLGAFYNNGNYAADDKKVGKSYYSAQIMADSGSHAYVGFESYSQEHIINKLEMMAQNEYFAYLENLKEGKQTGIKGYNPKLMFIPGLIENRNNLKPDKLQEAAEELMKNNAKLREAIKSNLDRITEQSIKEFEAEGLIEGVAEGIYFSKNLDYRIKDISEFIKDFVYNDFFAQTQIISLFHGKLYQYKSMEDFYKRAKEIWSPGNFIDTSRTGVNQKFMTYFVNSDSTELNYRNNKESVDAIYNNVIKAGFSEDDAKKAASGYGYTDGTKVEVKQDDGTIKLKDGVTLSTGKKIISGEVDATDAQGIIDIYRWREIMLGKGMEKNEVERIFDAIVNNTYTIDDLTMVMNPIKQFYYTLINVNGQVSGLQIKNSEYVLLPQIAKGNKQLEGILDFFKKSRETHNNVNASINYDSAVKVGLHNLNASTETLDVNKGIELNNSEYRIQGEVPEHQVDTTNLLGTQLRKLVVGDLNLEDVYEVGNNKEKINGKELINEWNQLLIADIWHSSESLQKEFSNPTKFYQMLQDEARSRDYPDKFIEALTLVDGKPRLGLFHPLLTKKAQALISSVFRNRITKMKFNGMSTPNAALSNKKLSILYNADGSINAFEAELPLWSKSLVEGMDVVTTEELAKLGLDLGVAYRIPTEGKYSMIPIKIVGFTNAGIVLPPLISKVSGLDYDIDKMYVMLYEFITKNKKPVKVEFQANPTYKEYVKNVKYSKDTTKLLKEENVDVKDPNIESILVDKELLLTESDWNKLNVYQKNSQKARDNRKLDIIRSVLNNPKTIKAQLTPGGFDDLKAEANRIEKEKGSQLGSINPMTLISRVKIFARMMAGKKLIGIPANYNATHALMQHQGLKLVQPVLFNGQEADDLGLVKLWDDTDDLISNNFAQYLASVVDNGKDPLADKYNLNTYTADVAMLMAKFFPIETGMKFIAQPSIVEFYKEYVNGGANRKAESKAIEKMLGKSYNKAMEDFVLENIDDSDLEKGLTESPKTEWQKKFLMHFLYYKNNQAKDLSKLVSAIKVPDTGASASIAKTVNNVAKVNDALKLDTIVGVKEFLTNENLSNTALYEKGIEDALEKFVELGFPDYVKPDSAFVKVFEQLAELKGSILSEKEIGLVNDATYSFLSSGFTPIKNIDTLEVIKNVPILWAEFVKLNRKEYYALMGSIESVASEHNEKELKLILNNNQPKDVENKVMNQWEDLLKSSKPINSNYTEGDLGRMLTEYAFVTNGFRFTTGSLSHIQPISFYENLTDGTRDYNTFIEQQIDTANNDKNYLSQFYDQFVRHYFPRLSYVKTMTKEDADIRFENDEPWAMKVEQFGLGEYVKYRDEKTRQWYLFKEYADLQDEHYYQRVNPLGLYREAEEWNFDITPKESLFPQNNMSKEIEQIIDTFLEVGETVNKVVESTANVEESSNFEKFKESLETKECIDVQI